MKKIFIVLLAILILVNAQSETSSNEDTQNLSSNTENTGASESTESGPTSNGSELVNSSDLISTDLNLTSENKTNLTDDNNTDSNVTDGNNTDSNVTDGNNTDSNVTDGNYTDSNVTDGNNTNTEEPLSEEEALAKMNVSLSFRQVNNFTYDEKNNSISFKFFGITTQSLPAGYVFYIDLYLILSDDQKDTQLSTAECYLPEEVNTHNEQKQAEFDCKIVELDQGKEYKSFEIHKSEQIAGIPEDETLLDPVKTAEAIKNGTLLDYSKEENKKNYPAYFSAYAMNPAVTEDGNFTIRGYLNQEIEEDVEFTLHLTFPPFYKLQCVLPKSKPDHIDITCQLNLPIRSIIVIEQQVIRKGFEEIFTFTTFWGWQILVWPSPKPISFDDAAKKKDVHLTFRQLNSFHFDPTNHFITFKFYGITTQKIEKGYSFFIDLLLILSDKSFDTDTRTAECTVIDEVNAEGEQTHAGFDCKIADLPADKQYYSFEIQGSEGIAGIPEDSTLLDPVKTALAILSGKIIDYSIEENRNVFPALFSTESISNEVSENGEFIITGSLNKEIEHDIDFTLRLTYPPFYFTKCHLPKAAAGQVEITCSLNNNLSGKIIIEQQVIRNGFIELFTFTGMESEGEFNWALKEITPTTTPTQTPDKPNEEGPSMEDVENKMHANITFRQVSGFFFNPTDYFITFNFFGLTRYPMVAGWFFYIDLFLFVQGQGKENSLTQAKCTLNSNVEPQDGKEVQADFSCKIDSDKLDKSKVYESFEISGSDAISGFPEDKALLNPVLTDELIKNGTLIDYNDPNNKEKIPFTFEAKSIDSTVSEKGEFKILGTVDQDITEDIQFTLVLTYPAGYETKCTLPKVSTGDAEITCVLDEPLNDFVEIEHQVIRDGFNELFTITAIRSEKELLWGESPSMEDVDGKMHANITFRQVSGFNFDKVAYFITFNFFGLTSVHLDADYYFIMDLHLIFVGGVMDTAVSHAKCTLNNTVDPAENEEVQANFVCKVEELDKSKEYESLEIIGSDAISGIPEDKTLLNPSKVDELIESGNITDYNDPENQKPPLIFEAEKINSTVSEEGEFKILGTVNQNVTEDIQFTLELTYPVGYMTKCSLPKVSTGNAEIICVLDQPLNDFVEIEHQVIRDGFNELFTITSVKSNEKLSWKTEGNLPSNNETNPDSNETNPDSNKTNPDSNETNPDSNETNPDSNETNPGSINNTNEDTNQTQDSNITSDEGDVSNISSHELSNETSPNDTESDNNNTHNEDGMTFEEAADRAKIKISFRQLSQYQSTTELVTFVLYTLVSDQISKGLEIKLFINLIDMEGEREEETKEVGCSLKEDVLPPEGESLQGTFECSLAVTKEYYSFRLNYSDDIAGIPNDEVLLDPKLTEEAIRDGLLLDYSLPENQAADKIPATFTAINIKEDTCKSNGKFLIEGTLSKEITSDLRFTIPLIYPDGISADCNLLTKEKGESQISCQVDRNIEGDFVVFEQTIIKDGPSEIMNMGGLASADNLTCANGLLGEAEKKLDVKVSFRQVSHLESNGVNGFNFFFAAFANANLNAGHKIIMKIFILFGEIKKEKEVECTLQSDVQIQEGKQVQGNYKCEAKVSEEEYKEIDFNNTEAIKVAPDNPEIGGVSDEDGNLSPLETDISINETNEKNEANETMTELGECLDYSIEENINKEPPSLEITSVSEIQEERGKVILIGKFSGDIEEETTFELPLSYPITGFKCKVESAKKDEEVEFTCKIQQKFKLVQQFVFEPRLLKKRFKEELFIKPIKFDLPNPIACEDYNALKYKRTKIRQKADFSFLQLSNFRPIGPKVGFFFGAIKAFPTFVFQQFTIVIHIRIQINGLRQLASQSSQDLPVTCKLKGESSTAGGFDCTSDDDAQGTPLGMEVSEDSPIAGLPDPADPDKIPSTDDYSDVNKLNEIDDLPNIEIKEIDGTNCGESGDYTIKGTIVNNGKLADLEGIDIPFSSPDSVGRCDIKVNNKDVQMNCHNKEKFTASPILFEQNIIKDSQGKALFVLQKYTNQKSFACALSVNSVAAKSQSSSSSPSDQTNDSSTQSPQGNSENIRHYYKNSESGGLKGGAIAALVIPIVAAIAIFAGVLLYCTKNTKPPVDNSFNNSTIDKIAAVPNTNN